LTARTDAESGRWREKLVRTFVERDLPLLGFRLAPQTMQYVWTQVRLHQLTHLAPVPRATA